MRTKGSIWIALSILTAALFGPWPTAPRSLAAAQSLSGAQSPLGAQSPIGIEMEASAAYGGHLKYGEWLPVWVYLENSGQDLEVEARVRVTGSSGAVFYARQVSLPSGSRKRVSIYVLPNNFARQLEVQVLDAKGDVLVSQEAPVKPQPNINFLAGLVASERGALSLLSATETAGRPRPKVLLDIAVDELPERVEGLRSFDLLILNDVDTSPLTPKQRQALATWVRQGGRLVIGGGAGARRTVAGLQLLEGSSGDILPLNPRRELEMAALPGLAAYVGGPGPSDGASDGEPVRVPGPFLVSVGDLSEGQTMAEQEGVPLIRQRAVGDGTVSFVALDLAGSPFDAWAGAVRFWEQLVVADASYPQDLPPDLSPRQMRSSQMTYALSNLPALALPSVRGLSVLLIVYILLVGPINYLVLRWRKRLHWAWGTIPALTLLFSGGTFGLGYALRGTDLVVNHIAVVAAQPDGTARVDSYIGLFSPARQSYEIEVEGDSLLSAVTPDYDPFAQNAAGTAQVHFVQGDPGQVRGLAVNQWSMQTFMAEGTWHDLGQVTSDLYFEEGALVGTVRNETSQALQDVVIVMGTQFQRLGDLAPGATAPVRLELSEDALQFFGPPISYRLFQQELEQPRSGLFAKDIQLKQQVLDSVLSDGSKVSPISSFRPTGGASAQELALLAWSDHAPPEVQVAGRQPARQTTALVYTPLTYRLAESGTVLMPPGFITGRVLSMPVEGGACGSPGIPAVYINRGEATFEFELPESARQVQIERLTVSLRTEGGWQQPPEVAIYEWAEQTWSDIAQAVIGDNVLTEVNGLVSDNGLVRVRLSFDSGGGGGCYYVGVGFEGER